MIDFRFRDVVKKFALCFAVGFRVKAANHNLLNLTHCRCIFWWENAPDHLNTPGAGNIWLFNNVFCVVIIRVVPPLPLRWYGLDTTVKFSSPIKSSMEMSSLCHDSDTVMSWTFFSLINTLNWSALLYKLRGFTFKITGSSKAWTNLSDLWMGFRNLFVCFLSFLCLIKIVTLAFGAPLLTPSDLVESADPREKNHCETFLSHCEPEYYCLHVHLCYWSHLHWPQSGDNNTGCRIYSHLLWSCDTQRSYHSGPPFCASLRP